MEDEVFQGDEFAVDPQRGTGIGEVGPFYPSWPTGERAMRSSRRVSAIPASNVGRIETGADLAAVC